MGALLALGMAGACGGSSSSRSEDAHAGHRGRTSHSEGDDGEDGVALSSSRGVLEPEQIRASVEPHSNELSACYISRVGARTWLGGRISMKWKVAADGAITQVHVAESDLGAWPVEKCLLAVAHKMTFAPPRGGATEFTVPLEFSATGSAVVWTEPRSLEAVGDQLSQLDECSHPAADGADQPGAKGDQPTPPGAKSPPTPPEPAAGAAGAPRDVVLTLYVGGRGQPQSVGFATMDDDGIPDAWAECAQKVALAWHLPDPRGAVAKLAVRYLGDAQ